MNKPAVLVLGLLLTVSAFARDLPYIGKAYSHLEHPDAISPLAADVGAETPRLPHLVDLTRWQTSVKDQGKRGTCSVFSSIALVESQLLKMGYAAKDIDFSAEWLQFVMSKGVTDDGSNSAANFNQIASRGLALERTLPYIGEMWTDLKTPQAQTACGELSGKTLKSCLVGHRNPALLDAPENALSSPGSKLYDPELLHARQEAGDFITSFIANQKIGKRFVVKSPDKIKQLLNQGHPLTMDIDFYIGAWNHPECSSYGINRNMDHWKHGMIGFPEKGSLDFQTYKKDPGGHSVLIVGYDDDFVLTTKVQMQDGTEKEFSYKGVYIIKNSWSTDDWGSEFEWNGRRHPGYGMITQAYAHKYGEFFHFPMAE